MFYDRRRLDRQAVNLLDEIIEQRSGRISKARQLCVLSLDVWNILDYEARCAVSEIFQEDGAERTAPARNSLTRRYWAKKVQGVISRQRAIGLWDHLDPRIAEMTLSFEEALAGLSTFFDHTSSEVRNPLTYITTHMT
jgi:F-box protein 21